MRVAAVACEEGKGRVAQEASNLLEYRPLPIVPPTIGTPNLKNGRRFEDLENQVVEPRLM